MLLAIMQNIANVILDVTMLIGRYAGCYYAECLGAKWEEENFCANTMHPFLSDFQNNL
jgi:hypothetical protein